jgi:hypothetical protein
MLVARRVNTEAVDVYFTHYPDKFMSWLRKTGQNPSAVVRTRTRTTAQGPASRWRIHCSSVGKAGHFITDYPIQWARGIKAAEARTCSLIRT